MTYPQTNIIPLYPGLGCKDCKSCACKGRCTLGAEAHGVVNQNAGGERAQAFSSWIKNAQVRTAGGQYIGTSDLVEFVQQVHNMNIDIAKKVLRYTTTPGLIYTLYQAGGSTKTQIESRMETDPQFKKTVQDVTKKVLTTGSDVWDTIVNPIKGVSTTISLLPWIIIGGLIIAAVFAFKNPGSVSTPRRISLT